MADVSIRSLNVVDARDIDNEASFVLDLDGKAWRLPGQTLINWVTDNAECRGGIREITGPVSDGLRDTYTIIYADESTHTFTVTNGEKGDKGDNSYTWVKYSVKEPTSDSQLGDIPESCEYVGIYTGNSSTAPTYYTAYTWFKFKGEQGEKGEPALLDEAASSVSYGSSESDAVEPTEWKNTVAEVDVSQGEYLWTKVEIKFSTAEDVQTFYTVARYGVDGASSVKTVAGVPLDDDGNFPVTAAAVGAIPNEAGMVTRSNLATDALYSPISMLTEITVAHTGYTMRTNRDTATTFTLAQANSSSMMEGAEVAFLYWGTAAVDVCIQGTGVRFAIPGETEFKLNATLKIPDPLSIVAIKKIEANAAQGDIWLVTGNVEVVS